MTRLYLDLETFNEEPISRGSYRYAETVELMLFAFAINDQPARVWDKVNGEPMPADLKAAIKDPKTVFIAHNSMFDRTQLVKYSKRFADPKNWEDTMVRALLHGLPGKLEKLCELFHLGSDKAKDKDGKRLIGLFCVPQKKRKIQRNTKQTHPEEWERFVNYARLDVEAMRELEKLLPKRNWNQKEIALWHLDQKINDRGFAVDMALVDAAIDAVNKEQKALKKRTAEITDGALESTTKRDKFLLHLLQYYGIEPDNARASTIEDLLHDENLPPGLIELLRIRLAATTSSTAKYKKLKNIVCSDDRIRGGLQFSGASRTRRAAGRGAQPQNYPRPTLKNKDIESGIEALKAGVADIVCPDVMRLTSSALRGTIVPSKGKKLVVADLSNIEGRDQAWLARENWKLDAFRAYDTFVLDDFGQKIPDGRGDYLRKGPDLYAKAYAKMFNVTPESVMEDRDRGGSQRQVGKTAELACLGADTRVVTNSGTKPITHVTERDRLWDGNRWVRHGGLLRKGDKETLKAFGISATADHEFLIGDTWIPWCDFVSGSFEVKEGYEPTFDILNAGEKHRFTILDKDCNEHIVHNCGYGGGVGSFVTFATSFDLDLDKLADDAYDKIDARILQEADGMWEWATKKKRTLDLQKKTFVVMDSFKRQWREAHPNIATTWELLEQGVRLAIANPKEVFTIGRVKIDYTGKWLFIRLPSGGYLCYPSPAVDDSGQITFMGPNQITKKWGKTKTYGGKIFENCIDNSTLVCTNRGYVPLREVLSSDLLWDGENWVEHKGVVFRGRKETVKWLGFRVTLNHRIFDGKLFRSVTASGVFATLAALKWARCSVLSPCYAQGTETTDTRSACVLVERRKRLISASFGAGRVFAVLGATLRKSLDVSINTVISSLTKKYETYGFTDILESSVDAMKPPALSTRIMGQEESAFMALGRKTAERSSSTPFSSRTVTTLAMISTELTTTEATCRGTYVLFLGKKIPAINVAIVLSNIRECLIATRSFVKSFYLYGTARTLSRTICRKVVQLIGSLPSTTRVVDTYDILEAGPNNRFTISTSLGPLVIHNCSQSLARDVMFDNMQLIEDAGYAIVLSVHDELITEAPDSPEFNAAHLSSLLSRNPPWALDMPLSAAGFESYRYRKG